MEKPRNRTHNIGFNMNRIYPLILIITIAFSASHCSKTDEYQSDQITDYMNFKVGKYVIYQLDSLVKKPFDDTAFIVRSYQAKDVMDALITDNIGRPSWRVIRYLRDTASKKESDWIPNHTYMITPLDNTVEVIDNNMRYQKLKLPIKDGYTWRGNSYIYAEVGSSYAYLADWDYTYENVGGSFKPMNAVIDSTITVFHIDDVTGIPGSIDSYSDRIYSTETYGKGIGLIYKEFLYRSFQPRRFPDFPQGYTEGYGLKLRMISHN